MPPEDEKEEKSGLEAMLEAEDQEIKNLTAPHVEEKPVVEEEPEKPPEEEKKPVEPEQPKEEKRETKPWKQLKETERLRKQLEQENAELKRQLAEAAKQKEIEPPPDDFEDPLDKVREEFKTDLEQTKAKVDQTARQLEEKAIYDDIVRQENDFAREHPDYKAALDHLVESARTEWTYDGSISKLAKNILKGNRAELEQWAIDNHNPDNKNSNFIDEDTGEVKFSDAAKEAAFRVLVNARRQAMVNNWRDEGRNVAQAAYEFAQARGFSVRAPAKEEEKKDEIAPARERVIRAKETEAATASLSSMQDRGNRRPGEIKKRSQILDMDDNDREAYIDKMDKENPGWFEKLE